MQVSWGDRRTALAEMEQQVNAEIDDAVEFAQGSDPEPVADLERFVYVEEGHDRGGSDPG